MWCSNLTARIPVSKLVCHFRKKLIFSGCVHIKSVVFKSKLENLHGLPLQWLNSRALTENKKFFNPPHLNTNHTQKKNKPIRKADFRKLGFWLVYFNEGGLPWGLGIFYLVGEYGNPMTKDLQ